ncbi:hypothetical protein BDV40DRAFT_285404 [Aspergillus tamarii]|uniref:DUF6536 domain-containing protein n=1 Tax=Aspergillus tamarii TaxID=41984 RepID=A0A5N6V702_ASPTM|nr:hypothetical protein BDV40DRAFT_285404 [Aspergillus tamarii]
MLKTQMGIATIVVIFNLSITIWAVLSYPPDGRGVGTFSFSDCSSASALNSALHVALNIISSLFLGAGNYCMQILVAPSRDEIAQTHLKGSALEIGVLSMRNLRYIKKSRVAAWFGIGFIVGLLHFFWNSAIFTSFPIVVIPRAVATNDFLTVRYNWTASDPLSHFSWWKPAAGYGEASKNTSMIYTLQDGAANFTYLDTEACIKRYINPMTATSSVIIVARNVSTVQNNGSSLIDGWVSGWEPWSGSSSWICRAHQDIHKDRFCNWDFAKSFTNDWKLSWPRGVQVDHCLSADEGRSRDRCGLHYSTHILAIVCVCTFLESLLVYWTAFHHFRNMRTKEQKRDHRTMVTIGDAINSFLEHPRSYINELTDEDDDASTCYRLGAVQIQKTTWLAEPRVSWFKAVNIHIWVISLILFFTGLAITSYSIGSSIEWISQKGVDVSPAALWQYGFQVNPAMLARDMGPLNSIAADGAVMLLGNILIANSPQVMVSFLYLFYNNILTRQLVSDEWVRFLQEEGKKPLRVSSPEGMQRSSYFLSLPFKYSVPLMVLAILLHWLISQSIFLVQSSAFAPGKDGTRLPMYDYTARGYSPLGSIMAIALAFALVVALLLNSVFRSYRNIPANFHLMAFNSSAIEALCQRPEADSDARLFPVRIGVAVMDSKLRTSPSTLSESSYTAVVFSTDTTLQVPEHGGQYLQPILICVRSQGKDTIYIRMIPKP